MGELLFVYSIIISIPRTILPSRQQVNFFLTIPGKVIDLQTASTTKALIIRISSHTIQKRKVINVIPIISEKISGPVLIKKGMYFLYRMRAMTSIIYTLSSTGKKQV